MHRARPLRRQYWDGRPPPARRSPQLVIAVATRNTRLEKLEQKLRSSKPQEPQGWYQTHYTNAWPAARDLKDVEVHHCTEHGETCAYTITRFSATVKRMLILEGATADVIGLD